MEALDHRDQRGQQVRKAPRVPRAQQVLLAQLVLPTFLAM